MPVQKSNTGANATNTLPNMWSAFRQVHKAENYSEHWGEHSSFSVTADKLSISQFRLC